jgi:hypothetical protein
MKGILVKAVFNDSIHVREERVRAVSDCEAAVD